MKFVLIVDDTYSEKTRIIASKLTATADVEFEVCQSTRDALKILRSKPVNVLIVDLQIPDFLGSDIEIDGGVKLLKSISERSDELNVPTHIIGVTAHRDSFDSASQYFLDQGWPLLMEKDLENRFSTLIQSKLDHSQDVEGNIDVVIITALKHTELEAVLKLPYSWCEFLVKGNFHTFYKGEFVDKSGVAKKVITLGCTRMGSSSSAVTATQVLSMFNPKLILMVGIAAGIKGKVDLGDVLVADSSWDWESGKSTVEADKSIFKTAPHQIQLDQRYRDTFQNVAVSRAGLDAIQNDWSQPMKVNRLKLHVGPIVSGSSVLEDPSLVERIQSQHRGVIGIEMEGYGVALASSLSSSGAKWLLIKSVCDFAGPDKNDDYQAYSAYTSSKVADYFLRNHYE